MAVLSTTEPPAEKDHSSNGSDRETVKWSRRAQKEEKNLLVSSFAANDASQHQSFSSHAAC